MHTIQIAEFSRFSFGISLGYNYANEVVYCVFKIILENLRFPNDP